MWLMLSLVDHKQDRPVLNVIIAQVSFDRISLEYLAYNGYCPTAC